jgi:hypothetical protein
LEQLGSEQQERSDERQPQPDHRRSIHPVMWDVKGFAAVAWMKLSGEMLEPLRIGRSR